MIKCIRILMGGLLWLVVTDTPAFAGNVLSNPGFESDAPGENRNIVGWTWYGQPWTNTFSETGPAAGSGNNYFKVFQGFTGSVNYNGIFQDYISGPGAAYTADGWGHTLSTDALAGRNTASLGVHSRHARA